MRVLIILAGMITVGCSYTTVEEDVRSYCDCVDEKGNSKDVECVEKANEILIKYEFDPEASTYIEKELKKCMNE